MTYARIHHAMPVLVSLLSLTLVFVVVTLAVPNGWVLGLAVLVAAAMFILGSAVQQRRVSPRMKERAHTPNAFVADSVREQRVLTLPDGSNKIGRIVPQTQAVIWDLALTSDGYVLVDQAGRIRHTF